MAVTLIGEVVNDCDDPTGGSWTASPTFVDDPLVQGTAAVGEKVSATTIALYTTTLGAGAPYDFSVGGANEGNHIIMWFNTKIPIDATTGFRVIVGNGTDRGEWYVHPRGFYAGGFVTRVVDTARDFDNIDAGTWTTSGNPAQQTSITQMGGTFTTTASVMGSFNTCQLDQFTIGSGLRVDAGTSGTPNTFETVRVADEDTAIYGWWSSAAGANLGKGKLYIGPNTTDVTSVFNDSAFSVIFADENVGSGFYEIYMRGANTTVDFALANISSADTETTPFTRWSLTCEDGLKRFDDVNGTWQNADQITLGSTASLVGTSLIDCRRLTQNSGSLSSCTIINSDRGDGEAFILSDYPSNISACEFTQSSGHAIEFTPIASGKTIAFAENTFIGYEGTGGSNETPNSGPTNAAIFNNSSGAITLNVTGGGTSPVVRNGLGATTTVVAAVSLILTDLITDSEIRVYTAGTTTELDGIESSSGSFQFDFQGGDPNVDLRIFHIDYDPVNLINFSLPAANTSIPIQQNFDRNYENQ